MSRSALVFAFAALAAAQPASADTSTPPNMSMAPPAPAEPPAPAADGEMSEATPPAYVAEDPFAVRKMHGPYPSLDTVCKALRGEPKPFGCSTEPLAKLDKPPLPYREVIVMRARELDDPPRECDKDPMSWDLQLAVRLDAGWYVADAVAALDDLQNHGGGSRHKSVKLSTTVVAGAPAIVVRVQSFQQYRGQEGDLEWLSVAGLGPSGTPAWLGPVLLSENGSGWRMVNRGEDTDEVTYTIRQSFRWKIEAAGALVLRKGPSRREWSFLEPDEVGRAIGRHPLAFP